MPPRLDQSDRLVQSEEVARRELLEEVGGTAADVHFVGQFYTSNGISDGPSALALLWCEVLLRW